MIMCRSHFLTGTLLLQLSVLSVLTSDDQKEITKNFSCCELPIKIEPQLNRNYDHEFSIGSKSVGIVRRSVLTASPPFSVHENTSFILDDCVDFVQRTFFENEKGSRDENWVHHRGLPCNRTALDNPLHGRNNTAPENPLHRHTHAGIVGVFILLAVVVGGLLWRLRRRDGEPVNDV